MRGASGKWCKSTSSHEEARGRGSVQAQWSCIVYCTVLCSEHLGLNAVECKGGSSAVWDALNNVGEGEGLEAIGEGLGGELSLLAHEEECEAGDVRPGNAIRSASSMLAERRETQARRDSRGHAST